MVSLDTLVKEKSTSRKLKNLSLKFNVIKVGRFAKIFHGRFAEVWNIFPIERHWLVVYQKLRDTRARVLNKIYDRPYTYTVRDGEL